MSTAQENLNHEEDIRAELLRSVVDSLKHNQFDASLVPSILEHLASNKLLEAPLSSKTVYKEWKLKLDTLLHSKNQNARWASLLFLSQSLLFPPYPVLVSYSESWIKELLLILKRDEGEWVVIEALTALQRLVRGCCQWPDLKRNFVNNYGSQTFSTIISKVNRPGCGFTIRQEAFSTLNLLIDLIPTLARPHLKTIEEVVLAHARTSDPVLRKRVARTLALIPKSVRKTDDDEEKVEGIADLSTLFLKLVASLNDVFDRLFKNVIEDSSVDVGTQGLFQKQDKTDTKRNEELSLLAERAQFKNTLEELDFFTETLAQTFSVSYLSPSSIPVQFLLLVCQRALSVHQSTVLESGEKLTEEKKFLLLSSLPEIHCQVLNTIQLLVTRLKKKIFPHFQLVLKALRVGLTSANQEQPALVRTKIYETAKKAAEVLGGGPSVIMSKWLLPLVLSDLNSFTSVLRPHSLNEPTKRVHKRQKTGTTTSTPSTSNTPQLSPHSPARNLALQTEALQLVQVLLENGGNLWESDTRFQIDRLVVLLLECLDGSSLWDNASICSSLSFMFSSSTTSDLSSDLTIPQNWEHYLNALLTLLQTSLRAPVSNTQLFMGIGLNLFQRISSRCPSSRLQENSRKSVTLLEPLLHPSSAPLHSVFLPKDSTSSDSSNGIVGQLLSTLSKPIVFPDLKEEMIDKVIMETDQVEGKKRKISQVSKETPKENLKEKPKEASKETPKEKTNKASLKKETPREKAKREKEEKEKAKKEEAEREKAKKTEEKPKTQKKETPKEKAKREKEEKEKAKKEEAERKKEKEKEKKTITEAPKAKANDNTKTSLKQKETPKEKAKREKEEKEKAKKEEAEKEKKLKEEKAKKEKEDRESAEKAKKEKEAKAKIVQSDVKALPQNDEDGDDDEMPELVEEGPDSSDADSADED